MVALILQLVSGAISGGVTGAVMDKLSLGPIGNSLAGLVGGAFGGQLFRMLTVRSSVEPSAPAGLNLGSILANIARGGVVVMAILGLIRAQMAKSWLLLR